MISTLIDNIKPNTEKLNSGDLFNFNETLPLIAMQILFLMVILNLIFYNPIKKTLKNRDLLIHNTQIRTSDLTSQANSIYKQNEQCLTQKRKQAYKNIAIEKDKVQEIINQEITNAKKKTNELLITTRTRLEIQKNITLQILKPQINELAKHLAEKLTCVKTSKKK